jgi:hypothetical protein
MNLPTAITEITRFRLVVAAYAVAICLTIDGAPALAQSLALELTGREALPDFEIDGRPARIHTQGLYVTERHYYVSGRLEGRPKRPLLLRFDRSDLQRVEHVDLSPPAGESGVGGPPLDHPGGFDFDGESFWIPVSASRPRSRTVVMRVAHKPDEPLAAAQPEEVCRVDDHIGAIAVDRERKQLYAANWDTLLVHVLRFDGTSVEQIPRERLVTGAPDWALAVQDWKSLGGGQILLGAIDKSPKRDPNVSNAVVEIIDMKARQRVAEARLPAPDAKMGPVTREGLAAWGGSLFLLPQDLGADATVLRYRWQR